MNRVLEEIVRTRSVQHPTEGAIRVHSHVSEEEGQFLRETILSLRPKQTLEVGLGFGISALYICDALTEVGGQKHIVVDPLQDDLWSGVGRSNLSSAGFGDLVELFEESSDVCLPLLYRSGQ